MDVANNNKKNGIAAHVIQHIRDLIENGKLVPGMRLPPERLLATRLRVGRPVVREAIKALSMLEVLESKRGDGTYIKSLAALDHSGPNQLAHLATDFDMIELIEVRKIVEPRAAALAASRRTPRQLRELEQKLLSQEASANDQNVLVLLDYNFHDAILRASCNTILFDLVQPLAPLLLKCREIAAGGTENAGKVIAQHRSIFEAIRRSDAYTAEQLMKEHIDLTAVHLLADRTTLSSVSSSGPEPVAIFQTRQTP